MTVWRFFGLVAAVCESNGAFVFRIQFLRPVAHPRTMVASACTTDEVVSDMLTVMW